MDLNAYLERIGYHGTCESTVDTLWQLHKAHMYSVPFENLDIHLGIPITLSIPSLYDKIVRRRRGGFCYELNGLFGWLLEQLGFKVTMLSARVYEGAQLGPEFDHLVLRIGMEDPVIADVGFGDSFLEPLRLNTSEEVLQHGTLYRLSGTHDARVLERGRDSDWEQQYVFSSSPHRLAEFEAMCQHHQTSPESMFTRKVVCSRATEGGRITLSNGRLIITSGKRREERIIETEEEYRRILMTHFGIDLGEDARVDRLISSNAVE